MKRHGTMVTIGTLFVGACVAGVPSGDAAAQDGCFGTPKDVYAVGLYPHAVAVGDLDGDGAADLVVASHYSDDVAVLRNVGDGTFDEQIRYAAGNGSRSVAVGDLDGDGAPDLAVSNQAYDGVVSVRRNECPRSCPPDLDGNGTIGFEDLAALLSTWGPCTACPADINGTGDDWVGYDDLVMLLGAWGPCS